MEKELREEIKEALPDMEDKAFNDIIQLLERNKKVTLTNILTGTQLHVLLVDDTFMTLWCF